MNIPPTDPPGEEELRFQLAVVEGQLRDRRADVRRLEAARDRLLADLAVCRTEGRP